MNNFFIYVFMFLSPLTNTYEPTVAFPTEEVCIRYQEKMRLQAYCEPIVMIKEDLQAGTLYGPLKNPLVPFTKWKGVL